MDSKPSKATGKPFSSFEELYEDFSCQLLTSLREELKSMGAMMDQTFQQEYNRLQTSEDEINDKIANVQEFADQLCDLNDDLIKQKEQQFYEIAAKQANLERQEKDLVKMKEDLLEKKTFYESMEKENEELRNEVEKLLLKLGEKENEKVALEQREAIVKEKEDQVKLEQIELQKRMDKVKENETSLMKKENSVMEMETAIEDREKMLTMQEKAFIKKEKEVHDKEAEMKESFQEVEDLKSFLKEKKPVGNVDWISYLDFLDSLMQTTGSGSENRTYLLKARRVAEVLGKKLDLLVRLRHVIHLDVAHDDVSNPGKPLIHATGKGYDLIEALMNVSFELKRLMLACNPHGNDQQSSTFSFH